MQSSFSSSFSIFPYGYRTHYSLTSRLEHEQLPPLAAELTGLINRYSSDPRDILVDLKGRDPSAALELTLKPEAVPTREELLHLEGEIVLPALDEADEDTDTVTHPFYAELYSQFLDFDGPLHIRHRVSEARSELIPADLTFRDLSSALGVRIDYLRFGLEQFRFNKLSAAFGFAPVVSQYLLLECTACELRLEILAEGLRDRKHLPFSKQGVIDELDRALAATPGIRLIADYRKYS